MKQHIKYTSMLVLALLITRAVVVDAVSPETAGKLDGPELTPLGAERPGNAAGYETGMHHIDPYADDEVLFSISADNIEEHADHLSEGQKALLRLYPTWHMQVYPTRRSASYPDWVYAAVMENSTTASVITVDKGGVANSNVSSPFPIPQSGVEAVWNHSLRWRGIRISRTFGQAALTRKGRYTVTLALQDWVFPYAARPESELRQKFPNILLALKSKIIQPGLTAGDGTLVLEPVDRTRDPRKSWSYSQALRRVLRAPYIANDYPAASSDGLRTVDEFDMFNGSPERFEWQLLGKQELYIPYNAYHIDNEGQSPEDILQTKHINPDLARYELHRVWVVEGTLKPDMKHVYSRRVFYIDEDSWQIAAMDNYDLEGKLWRTAEAHAMNYYEVPVLWSALEVYYDLQEQRYLVSGMDGQRNPYQFFDDADPREFSPHALKYYIR